jgi:PLP dependent protein
VARLLIAAKQKNIMNFSIADKLQNVRQRIQKSTIANGRKENDVQLLAVSKKKPAQALVDVYLQGQCHFGENYLSEALEKQTEVQAILEQGKGETSGPVVWHFIGPVQSNKTRAIAENFDWVHSVERLKIAKRLNEQRPEGRGPLNICIQVNIDEEASKSGILLEELPLLAQNISEFPNLCLRGVMCIPKSDQTEASLQETFQKMKAAYDALSDHHPSVDTLSMGMSGDMDMAIACGSTMVRVGTALFGEREKN